MLKQKVAVSGLYMAGELKQSNEYTLALCAKYGQRNGGATSVTCNVVR